MIIAPSAPNEIERLEDLRALQILDTPAEERFDRITRLAAKIFHVPIAYIALIDQDRQWFKAQCGLSVDETGREVSFCSHTILQNGPLIVPDATQDVRFWDNPLVTGEPFIRFYAGCPLAPNGPNIGTLCLADRRPRGLDGVQLDLFRHLAALAEHELRMVDVIQVQHELLATQAKLAGELAEAADYVRSMLPARLEGAVRSDYRFVSSSQLGGDLLGHHWLDDRHLAIYLLDVCGHGVGASLLSTSVHTALRTEALPEARFDRPGEVLAALNRAFPMAEHNNKFFTIWYGVYDAPTRTLRYATAGHPPAVLFDGDGDGPVQLGSPSLMIGVAPAVAYPSAERFLAPGSRLYVYSDGVFEVPQAGTGPLLMTDGLLGLLARIRPGGVPRVEQVLQQIQGFQGSARFADDFSLLEVEFD
jgi:sigma-B regulation protein RsbU (phosphoserine phosphatase)